jgi:excisionase family DNA binding protein
VKKTFHRDSGGLATPRSTDQRRIRQSVRTLQSVEPEGRAIGRASNAITLADQIASFKGALTARQLSKILSISVITIYKLATRGALPSVRIGGCVRFCPTTVARWLRERGG